MREDPLWARIALLLNLVGTALLFLSFQATSSNFRLITTAAGDSALCVDKYAMMISSATTWQMGHMPCPDWEHSRPAAVVNVEHPSFVTFGFIASVGGFLLQFLTVPRRKTLAEINEEMRILRKERKKLELQNPQT